MVIFHQSVLFDYHWCTNRKLNFEIGNFWQLNTPNLYIGVHFFKALLTKFGISAPQKVQTCHINPPAASSELLRWVFLCNHFRWHYGWRWGFQFLDIALRVSGDLRSNIEGLKHQHFRDSATKRGSSQHNLERPGWMRDYYPVVNNGTSQLRT